MRASVTVRPNNYKRTNAGKRTRTRTQLSHGESMKCFWFINRLKSVWGLWLLSSLQERPLPAISVMGCPTKKAHTHRAQGEVLYCNLMRVQSVHKISMASAHSMNSLRQVSVYRESLSGIHMKSFQ